MTIVGARRRGVGGRRQVSGVRSIGARGWQSRLVKPSQGWSNQKRSIFLCRGGWETRHPAWSVAGISLFAMGEPYFNGTNGFLTYYLCFAGANCAVYCGFHFTQSGAFV